LLNVALIAFVYDSVVGESELAFGRLLGQDVTFKRMLSFDFTRTG